MLRTFGPASLWRRRDLRLMLPAQAVSSFGDYMTLVALTLRVYAEAHDPWAITGLLLCAAVPPALLAPIAGRRVDSLPFRSVAVTTAVWQAGCCAVLAFATPLWSTYLLALALQAGQVMAKPAWGAMLPAVAGDDNVARAVGTSQALNTLASVAAPAAAGVAVGLLGYAAPLLVDSISFLALGAAGVAIRARRGAAADDAPGRAEPAGGFTLRSDTLLWPLIVGLCVLVLAGSVANVVEVFLVRGTLGVGPTGFGLVSGLYALALVAGSLLAGRSASDPARARRTMVAALVLALGLATCGLAPTLAIFTVPWVVVGIANGVVNTDVGTLVLSRTPEAFRGRVLARLNGMVQSAVVAALVAGGLAGSLIGARATYAGAGLLMAATAVLLLAQRLRRGRVGAGLDDRAAAEERALEHVEERDRGVEHDGEVGGEQRRQRGERVHERAGQVGA